MLVLLDATIDHSVVVLFKMVISFVLCITLIGVFVELNKKLDKNEESREKS